MNKRRTGASKYRSYGDAPERGNSKGSGNARSNSQLNICCSQKGRKFQTSNKFETSEHLYSIYTLQNGKSVLAEGTSSTRELNVQVGSERCLFFSSHSGNVSGNDKVHVRMVWVAISEDSCQQKEYQGKSYPTYLSFT